MSRNTCKICGKAKEVKSGKLEHYLELCSCELKDEQFQAITICKSCGRRIEDRRAGSLTQYVFRYDTCSCDIPAPFKHALAPDYPQKSISRIAEEVEEELDVTPGSFPQERFKPIKKLGSGATGIVYLARDLFLGKKVAVKTLHSLDSAHLILFQQEAKATSKLSHPNIVSILDFGCTEEGTPYMVLEYFDGISLDTYLEEHNHISWQTYKKVMTSVCDALGYTHSQGIYHRDLKPSNILVSDLDSDSPGVKLIDFGVAKLVDCFQTTEFQGRTLAGTPEFMSPDVANGYVYSSKSDIYSLGCVAFKCLTGKLPFVADSALQVISLHAKQPAPEMREVCEIEIPQEAEEMVSKCLVKEPGQRPSVDELLETLSGKEIIDTEYKNDNAGALEKPVQKIPATPIFLFLTVVIVLLVGIVVIQISFGGNTGTYNPEIRMEMKRGPSIDSFLPCEWEGGIVWYKKGFITDDDLFKLDSRSEFQYLSLWGERDFTEIGLRHLLSLNLKGLALGRTDIDFKNLELIAERKPNLDALIIDSSNFKDSELRVLPKFKRMRILDISKNRIGDEGLKYVGYLKNLEFLKIGKIDNLSEEGARYIGTLPRLRCLCIDHNKLNNKVWKLISQMESLETLSASETGIDDSGIKLISQLNLKKLDVSGNSITGKQGLKTIAQMKSLDILMVKDGDFSDAEIEELKTSLPDCEVFVRHTSGYSDGNALMMKDNSFSRAERIDLSSGKTIDPKSLDNLSCPGLLSMIQDMLFLLWHFDIEKLVILNK